MQAETETDAESRFVRVHRGLTNSGALLMVLVSSFIIMLASYLFSVLNGVHESLLTTSYLFMILGGAALVAVVFFMLSPQSPAVVWFLFLAILVGFLIFSMVFERPKESQTIEFDKVDPYLIPIFVCIWVATAVGTTTGRNRIDGFALDQPAYLALFAASGILAYVSMHLFSYFSYKLSGLSAEAYGASYIGATFGIILLILLLIEAGNKFTTIFTGNKYHDTFGAGELAQSRRYAGITTLRVLRILIIMAVAIPALVVWNRKIVLPFEDNSRLSRMFGVLGGFLIMLPALALFGVELFDNAQILYNVIGSIFIAYTVFVTGVRYLYWSKEMAYGLFVIFLMFLSIFLSGNFTKTSISMTVVLAGLFVGAKKLGSFSVDYIGKSSPETVKNDFMVLLIRLVPVALFSLLWVVRNLAMGFNYVPVLVFFFFSVSYMLIYFYPNPEAPNRKFIEDGSEEQNACIDFLVLFTIISFVQGFSTVTEFGTHATNVLVFQNHATLTEHVTNVIFSAILAYVATIIYNEAQTSTEFKDYVKDSQKNAESLYNPISQSFNNLLV